MYAYHTCTLYARTVAFPEPTGYLTMLSEEWNIIGLPDDASLPKEDLLIQYQGVDYNWSEATSGDNPTGGPLVLAQVYTWLREQPQGYDFADVLEPGYGYWMYAYYECLLKREVS
jgi:hypothetical protein